MSRERSAIFPDARPSGPPVAVQIPPAVLRDPGLSFGAKVLFAALCAHAWPRDRCWPSQEVLAKDVSCTVRQVQRLLLQLRDAGLVSWKRQGLNRPNVYFLPAQESAESEDPTRASPPDKTR